MQPIKENIIKKAKALDDAIEGNDIDELVSYFADDCEIHLLGIKLSGKDGLRKAINWMFSHLKTISLIPITILVEGNTFFEEFTVKAKTNGGDEIQVNQSEVLVYDQECKVASLRLYFDRLELADALISNPFEKILAGLIAKASLKGIT